MYKGGKCAAPLYAPGLSNQRGSWMGEKERERERMMDDGRRVTRRVEVFFYLDASKKNCLIDSDNDSYNYLSIYQKITMSRYLSITS